MLAKRSCHPLSQERRKTGKEQFESESEQISEQNMSLDKAEDDYMQTIRPHNIVEA